MHDIDLIEPELLIDQGHVAGQVFHQMNGIQAGSEYIFVFFGIFFEFGFRTGAHGDCTQHGYLVFGDEIHTRDQCF